MFNKETVFILGAGASKPYGYPLGCTLIGEIINNITRDEIFLPEPWKGYFSSCGLEYQYEFKDFLKPLKDAERSPCIIPTNISQIDSFSSGPTYQKIKLYKIKEFNDLKDGLNSFAPTSIDAFLRDNLVFAEVGKIMIIYTLLKYENKNAFSHGIAQDNWYSLLINDLLSGCRKPQDIFNNKVNFITFNYDLSLEFCLDTKLSRIEFLQQEAIESDYVKHLIGERIQHVYGQLYKTEKLEEYGLYKPLNIVSRNLLCFIKACKSMREIKTISEERTVINTSIREKISNAKEIIILGFSFDPENLSVIGFPRTYVDYMPFLENKIFKYLNYNGTMKNVFSAFKRIREYQNGKIIESTSSSITDAYQNDFKNLLFDY